MPEEVKSSYFDSATQTLASAGKGEQAERQVVEEKILRSRDKFGGRIKLRIFLLQSLG
jgi:hypothetical protein